jgi:hypothetical protein
MDDQSPPKIQSGASDISSEGNASLSYGRSFFKENLLDCLIHDIWVSQKATTYISHFCLLQEVRRGAKSIDTLHDAMWLFIAAPVTSFTFGTGNALTLCTFRLAQWSKFLEIWPTWVLGDLSAILCFTPCILHFWNYVDPETGHLRKLYPSRNWPCRSDPPHDGNMEEVQDTLEGDSYEFASPGDKERSTGVAHTRWNTGLFQGTKDFVASPKLDHRVDLEIGEGEVKSSYEKPVRMSLFVRRAIQSLKKARSEWFLHKGNNASGTENPLVVVDYSSRHGNQRVSWKEESSDSNERGRENGRSPIDPVNQTDPQSVVPLLGEEAIVRCSFREIIIKTAECVAYFVILIVLSLVIFFNMGIADTSLVQRLSYLVFPVVIWAAFRFNRLGLPLSVLLIALIASSGTAHKKGPLYRQNDNHSLLQVGAGSWNRDSNDLS